MPNIFLLRNQVVQFSRSVVSDSVLIAQLVKKSGKRSRKMETNGRGRKRNWIALII